MTAFIITLTIGAVVFLIMFLAFRRSSKRRETGRNTYKSSSGSSHSGSRLSNVKDNNRRDSGSSDDSSIGLWPFLGSSGDGNTHKNSVTDHG
ncbi:MAG TPA: hypothetical protein PK671_23500, partial [Candidatus Obscuribacter sp.]|nr:hypothetical protein [Candidatus Obscuribacter sp.]